MKRNDEQFRFHDAESGAEVLVVVRTVETGIAICLSREDEGDTEVVLSPDEVGRLARALQERSG